MIPYVPDVVPDILQALVFAIAFTLVAAKPLRKHPLPFYAVFIVAAFFTFVDLGHINQIAYTIDNLLASCYTGVAFYLLVMFTGALPVKWSYTKLLYSIRSELSILAGFIIVAHVAKVIFFVPMSFTGYWPLIWRDAAPIMFAASTIVGLPLLVCFLAPWIASFPGVRKRMEYDQWKSVQKMAYPFMALLVAQGFLLAAGHAYYVGSSADNYYAYVATGATYLIIGALYVGFKFVKVYKENNRKQEALKKLEETQRQTAEQQAQQAAQMAENAQAATDIAETARAAKAAATAAKAADSAETASL